MITLSIIIPVYNCENYLKTGFEKLKKFYQYAFNFEVIYINDGSSDNSKEILDTFAQKHENIIIVNQENKGASEARNEGIRRASGKFISFIDADDYVDAKEYYDLVIKSETLGTDALGFRLDYRDENNNLLGIREKQKVRHDVVISGKDALIQGYNPSSFCVFIFKTKLLWDNSLFITPNICHEDIELTTRIMLIAQKVIFVDKIIYHYWQRSGSFSKPLEQKKIEKNLEDEIIVATLIKKNIASYKISDKDLLIALQKNYNAVVWNLIWRFISRPKEVDYPLK